MISFIDVDEKIIKDEVINDDCMIISALSNIKFLHCHINVKKIIIWHMHPKFISPFQDCKISEVNLEITTHISTNIMSVEKIISKFDLDIRSVQIILRNKPSCMHVVKTPKLVFRAKHESYFKDISDYYATDIIVLSSTLKGSDKCLLQCRYFEIDIELECEIICDELFAKLNDGCKDPVVYSVCGKWQEKYGSFSMNSLTVNCDIQEDAFNELQIDKLVVKGILFSQGVLNINFLQAGSVDLRKTSGSIHKIVCDKCYGLSNDIKIDEMILSNGSVPNGKIDKLIISWQPTDEEIQRFAGNILMQNDRIYKFKKIVYQSCFKYQHDIKDVVVLISKIFTDMGIKVDTILLTYQGITVNTKDLSMQMSNDYQLNVFNNGVHLLSYNLVMQDYWKKVSILLAIGMGMSLLSHVIR